MPSVPARPPVPRRSEGNATAYDVVSFLPTSGDTRYLSKSDFGRAPTDAYVRQIEQTTD